MEDEQQYPTVIKRAVSIFPDDEIERKLLYEQLLWRLAAGAGFGITAGSLAGLIRNIMRKPLPSVSKMRRLHAKEIHVPVKTDESVKEASWFTEWVNSGLPLPWVGQLMPRVTPAYKAELLPLIGGIGLPILGAVGGYKLVDKILRDQQKRKAEKRINQARKEYLQALQEMRDASNLNKKSSEISDFSRLLDGLTDEYYKEKEKLEKRGNIWSGFPSFQTLALSIALTSFVTSMIIARNKMMKTRIEKRQRKALDVLRRQRMLIRPLPVKTVPETEIAKLETGPEE